MSSGVHPKVRPGLGFRQVFRVKFRVMVSLNLSTGYISSVGFFYVFLLSGINVRGPEIGPPMLYNAIH